MNSSRPLPGVLISLLVISKYDLDGYEFSSPSRGSYISTIVKKLGKTFRRVGSRPLPGVLISLHL